MKIDILIETVYQKTSYYAGNKLRLKLPYMLKSFQWVDYTLYNVHKPGIRLAVETLNTDNDKNLVKIMLN